MPQPVWLFYPGLAHGTMVSGDDAEKDLGFQDLGADIAIAKARFPAGQKRRATSNKRAKMDACRTRKRPSLTRRSVDAV